MTIGKKKRVSVKHSEQIISSSYVGKDGSVMFFVGHKDVTTKQITVGDESIGAFMIALAKKKEFAKQHKCKLNLSTWEQVMA